MIAVGNGASWRWIDKGKGFNIVQLERLHAQDHRGQRRAQYLGIGKWSAPLEVVFAIQPYTEAGADSAASACALVGRRLADRLDAQLLYLIAPGIALNACKAAIHHIPYAWHCQRCFCNVGGQHDAASIALGAENSLLLRLR